MTYVVWTDASTPTKTTLDEWAAELPDTVTYLNMPYYIHGGSSSYQDTPDIAWTIDCLIGEYLLIKFDAWRGLYRENGVVFCKIKAMGGIVYQKEHAINTASRRPENDDSDTWDGDPPTLYYDVIDLKDNPAPYGDGTDLRSAHAVVEFYFFSQDNSTIGVSGLSIMGGNSANLTDYGDQD